MVFSISKLVLAVVVAVVTGLILVGLLGPIIVDIKASIAVTIGDFLIDWGWPIGILAGLWYYFAGPSFGRPVA